MKYVPRCKQMIPNFTIFYDVKTAPLQSESLKLVLKMLLIGFQCPLRPIKVEGHDIHPVNNEKDLGVTLDFCLLKHISTIFVSQPQSVHQIGQINNILHRKTLKVLFTLLSRLNLIIVVACFMAFLYVNYRSCKGFKIPHQD